MPLSEHEQKLLEQLEKQLHEDDPKFANSMGSDPRRNWSTRHIVIGVLATLAGVLLLLVGCFLDPLSAILLLSPLLVPLVKAAGIDTVHFGVVVTVNLAIGLFHPPFGINIFVAQSVLGLKLETIYRGIIPFVIIYLVALALITYIPDLSLIGVRYLLARG